MWRTLALLAILAPTAEADTCVGTADADKATAAARKKSEDSFAAALVRNKLVAVTLRLTTWGGDGADDESKTPRANTVVQRGGASVVVLGARRPNCSYDPDEFVQQGTKVFRVVRKPHVTKTTKLDVCDCEVIQFRCGGANTRPETYGYVLPDKTTYGGPMDVAYDAETVAPTYAVGRKQPCVRPQPPP